MKHLIHVFLFFFLFWAVLWAQSSADSTAQQLESLVHQRKFAAAAGIINALPDSTRNANWATFENLTEALADSLDLRDSVPQAIAVMDSALYVLRQAGRADSVSTADLMTWKAYFHGKLEQYSDVLDSYNEAIRVFTTKKLKGDRLAYCLKNVAQTYTRRHDYFNADKCLKAALESDTLPKYSLSIYGQLANNCYWWDSLNLALHYFELGKKNTDKGELNHLASLRSAGAAIFIKKGRYNEAEILARQALEYYQKKPEETINQMRSHTVLAEIASATSRPKEAERLYRQAEQIGLAELKNKRKSREMSKLYCEWGDMLQRKNRDSEAIRLYQNALVQAYPNFNDLDPAANPKKNNVPTEVWAMNAPARKADLLLRQPTLQNRTQAADCFDLAFAVAERLRLTYGTDDAKLYFAQNNYDLRCGAVLNLWGMYRETNKTLHLTRLFAMLEDNRANALRDALWEQKALASTGIPDSLLRIEDKFRRGIAEAQNYLAEADSSNQKQRRSNLNQLERRYDDLLRALRKNYPRFREYNQAGQTADLTAIRKALPEHAVLLTFFEAGDRYLCLRLRRNGLSAHEIPRDTALDQALVRFQMLLADKNAQAADPTAFFADAYFLKQRLLPDSVLAGAKALVIVPDGRLAYLPFEALLTAPHTGAYSKAPYLLRTHTVQYAWSATLLTDQRAQSVPERLLLHVAPFAEKARAGLTTLPNSLNEKPENTAGDLLKGEQALADTFLHRAATYDILHLSTHAHAGQRGQPGIEFSDRMVALPEIYAQRLNASLVALSACETNAGQFAEGEGVLSLARAFAYAGARSLVASYWSVNDRSTANLFTAFYRHLKKGMTKSEALRQAKLDLLAEPGTDARKMPYHWAAFTLSGADGPVALGGAEWTLGWLWALLGVGAGAGWIWYWQKNRRRRRL